MKNVFQKTGVPPFFSRMYYKIEKAIFPYKTAILETNVKTNRMVTKKWAYHREQSFASNYIPTFIFF